GCAAPPQQRVRGARQPGHRAAGQDVEDRAGADVREEDGGGEDHREGDQDADHGGGEGVGAGAVDPGAEHLLVVAEQQQEDGRGGQQDPGEGLDALGEQAQRRAGDQDDDRGQRDQARVDGVEALGAADTPVQGVVEADDVADGVGGGQRDGEGADDGGVEQGDGEQDAGGLAGVGGDAVGQAS